MARPRGENTATCQNSRCRYYQKENKKDIIKRGKNRAGHQQYRCLHCNKTFVETANTPLYYKHLSEKEITNICKLLVEKNGIRSIERVTGHHRDTIGRLLEDLAEHAMKVSDNLIREVGLGQFEVDEMWTTVKKSRRRLSLIAQLGLKKVMRGSTPA